MWEELLVGEGGSGQIKPLSARSRGSSRTRAAADGAEVGPGIQDGVNQADLQG